MTTDNTSSKTNYTFQRKTFILYFLVGLYPIYGVHEWGWTFSELISFYWFESFIILFDVMIRFWMIHPEYLNDEKDKEKEDYIVIDRNNAFQFKLKRTFMILFVFLFFAMLHGAAVFALFVNKSSRMATSPLDGMSKLFDVIFEHETLFAAVIASMLIHLVVLIMGYIIPGVHKTKAALDSFSSPFARLLILHISILVLGFILSFFNTDLFILVVLFVVFKSVIEAAISAFKGNKFDSIITDKG